MTPRFEFVPDPANCVGGKNEYVVHIPRGLASKNDLLALLREKMGFPPYIGANWDALLDALRDLSWLKPRRVVLVHEDVPQLEDHDMHAYLGVLESAIDDWKVGEDHELHAIFPEQERSSVMRCMRES